LIKNVKLYLLTNTITFLELQYEYRLSPTIRRRYLSNYRMLTTLSLVKIIFIFNMETIGAYYKSFPHSTVLRIPNK
jgi:hypothetical protein